MTLSDQISSLALDSLGGSVKQVQFISKALCLENAEVGLWGQHQRLRRSWHFQALLHSSRLLCPCGTSSIQPWLFIHVERSWWRTVCPLVTCCVSIDQWGNSASQISFWTCIRGTWDPGWPALSQARLKTSLWDWHCASFIDATPKTQTSPLGRWPSLWGHIFNSLLNVWGALNSLLKPQIQKAIPVHFCFYRWLIPLAT